MKYQCHACNKTFLHTAKITITVPEQGTIDDLVKGTLRINKTSSTEKSICPYCGSLNYDEITEPENTAEPANVYIYELTSGAQTGLDNLLAAGYKIVARYSKQYHLEKPKEAKL